MTSVLCPCLGGTTYAECCAPLHQAARLAPTAEMLMRSRFSAFAVGDSPYLLKTWHPSTRPAALDVDPETRWFRLDIIGHTGGGPFDRTGTVEFRAHYRAGGTADSLHEVSRFVREERFWYYLGALP
jgi:SEC-C motif-containing protein